MKLKLIASVLVLMVAITGVLGATAAYFSDYGTSNNNTFTAGSIDLLVDGSDANVTLFNLTDVSPDLDVRPGQQITNSYTLKNDGSLDGYLNIKDISIKEDENLCIGPEQIAGDDAASLVGELGNYLEATIFYDLYKTVIIDDVKTIVPGSDGWVTTGDIIIYRGSETNPLGKFSDLTIEPTSKDLLLKADDSVAVVGFISNWFNNGNSDNLAQTDSLTLDFTFTLDQKKAPNQNPIPVLD